MRDDRRIVARRWPKDRLAPQWGPRQIAGPNSGNQMTTTRSTMSIVDVARIADVSVATVSRVLNAPTSVRAETADRVHAAMQRLGYSVPTVRRGPKMGPRASGARPNQIAVIAVGKSLRWFEQPAMGGILAGITSAARQTK